LSRSSSGISGFLSDLRAGTVLEPRLLRADKTEMGTLRDKPGLRRFLRRTPRGLLAST
jgi:hypothetical protein